MKEVRLFTPGPTPVPEEVRAASARPMIHHRSEEFGAILSSVRSRLNQLCDTRGETVVFTSSGSGGMEAAVASLLSPGDEVIVVHGGKFGERWVDLAAHHHLKTTVVTVEWGRAAEAAAVTDALTPTTKAILMQACESSTGAYHPVAEIGKALAGRDDVLFVVDAITALGIHDLSMERDRIDVLIGASQKALMSPPGLATVSVGPRALARLPKESRNFYFSLQRELKAAQKGQTGFTPAISLFQALDCALQMIEKEGKPAVFARHKALQAEARNAFKTMGLKLFNRDAEATAGITVALAPEKMDVKAWLKNLRKEEGLWLAGGQGELEGKIFRLSHMGACKSEDLRWALDVIKRNLA